jgi:hypothetical protein
VFPALSENVKSFSNTEKKNIGRVSAGSTLSKIRCSSVVLDLPCVFLYGIKKDNCYINHRFLKPPGCPEKLSQCKLPDCKSSPA